MKARKAKPRRAHVDLRTPRKVAPGLERWARGGEPPREYQVSNHSLLQWSDGFQYGRVELHTFCFSNKKNKIRRGYSPNWVFTEGSTQTKQVQRLHRFTAQEAAYLVVRQNGVKGGKAKALFAPLPPLLSPKPRESSPSRELSACIAPSRPESPSDTCVRSALLPVASAPHYMLCPSGVGLRRGKGQRSPQPAFHHQLIIQITNHHPADRGLLRGCRPEPITAARERKIANSSSPPAALNVWKRIKWIRRCLWQLGASRPSWCSAASCFQYTAQH